MYASSKKYLFFKRKTFRHTNPPSVLNKVDGVCPILPTCHKSNRSALPSTPLHRTIGSALFWWHFWVIDSHCVYHIGVSWLLANASESIDSTKFVFFQPRIYLVSYLHASHWSIIWDALHDRVLTNWFDLVSSADWLSLLLWILFPVPFYRTIFRNHCSIYTRSQIPDSKWFIWLMNDTSIQHHIHNKINEFYTYLPIHYCYSDDFTCSRESEREREMHAKWWMTAWWAIPEDFSDMLSA